jgi:phage protein U
MDSHTLIALGEFRFAMSTAAYQTLERESEWRWPATDVVGVRPMAQYVGPGEDTIRLSGVVYPHFGGAGLGQIDAMRAEADKGVPLRMVDGTGRNWGRWAITSVRENQTVFWSNGSPRSQEFQVCLKFVDWGKPAWSSFITGPDDGQSPQSDG